MNYNNAFRTKRYISILNTILMDNKFLDSIIKVNKIVLNPYSEELQVHIARELFSTLKENPT